MQKEVELADRLSGQLNDLAHQTREDGLRRIAGEASSTAGSFAASLRAKQHGDGPETTARSNAGGDIPDAAPAVTPGMLAGILHPNSAGNADDDWNADYNYNSNKLRNEMNALNHLCQASGLGQPDGSVAAGSRRSGA